jgi:hypothetical protein
MANSRNRFQAWFASAVFAAVCLAAHRNTDTWDKDDKGKWVLSDFIIILVVACVGALATMFIKKLFVGRLLEGALSLFMVILWCAGLPPVMNPDNSIAVTGAYNAPTIINPNLFFFSWVAFAFSIYIFGSYLQEATGRELSVDSSSKHVKFAGILAASVVILVTASNIHTDADCNDSKIAGDEFCKRNKFAVSLGAVGVFFTLFAMLLTFCNKMVVLTERVYSLVVVGMATAGVALITFDEGSGTQMSNLYFATWALFALCVLLSAQIAREFFDDGTGDDEEVEAADEEKGEKSRNSEEQEQPAPDETEEVVEPAKQEVEA